MKTIKIIVPILFLALSFQSKAQYCAATNTDCAFEFITNVTFSTINNNSACDAPYDDFTAQVGDIQVGTTITGLISKSGTVATYVASVYIDWDQNQVFDITTEEIQAVANATTTGFTFDVTPPAGAVLGQTRMRVRMTQLSNTPNPCGASTRGDLEDYTINLTNTPPPPPANNDCANAIANEPATACSDLPGTTGSATESLPPTACSGNTAAAANDVWYSFTCRRNN